MKHALRPSRTAQAHDLALRILPDAFRANARGRMRSEARKTAVAFVGSLSTVSRPIVLHAAEKHAAAQGWQSASMQVAMQRMLARCEKSIDMDAMQESVLVMLAEQYAANPHFRTLAQKHGVQIILDGSLLAKKHHHRFKPPAFEAMRKKLYNAMSEDKKGYGYKAIAVFLCVGPERLPLGLLPLHPKHLESDSAHHKNELSTISHLMERLHPVFAGFGLTFVVDAVADSFLFQQKTVDSRTYRIVYRTGASRSMRVGSKNHSLDVFVGSFVEKEYERICALARSVEGRMGGNGSDSRHGNKDGVCEGVGKNKRVEVGIGGGIGRDGGSSVGRGENKGGDEYRGEDKSEDGGKNRNGGDNTTRGGIICEHEGVDITMSRTGEDTVLLSFIGVSYQHGQKKPITRRYHAVIDLDFINWIITRTRQKAAGGGQSRVCYILATNDATLTAKQVRDCYFERTAVEAYIKQSKADDLWGVQSFLTRKFGHTQMLIIARNIGAVALGLWTLREGVERVMRQVAVMAYGVRRATMIVERRLREVLKCKFKIPAVQRLLLMCGTG